MVQSGGGGVLVRKDFVSADVEEMANGTVVSKRVITPIGDGSIITETDERNDMAEVIEPEVVEPEIVDENSENLPEVYQKFKSFRETFLEQNRQRNSFLNAITDKMAKQNEMLRNVDTALGNEMRDEESMLDQYVKK